MPQIELESLKAYFVILNADLLSDQDQFDAFRSTFGTEVIVRGGGLILGGPGNVAEPGRSIALARDRIELELAASRSTISREYPSLTELDRLAQVISTAFQASELDIGKSWTYGYNFEMAYELPKGASAFQHVGKSLFGGLALGGNPLGGAGNIVIEDGGDVWDLALESRFRDRVTSTVYVRLNLHRDRQIFPTHTEIKEEFERVWNQAERFVNRLNGSSEGA